MNSKTYEKDGATVTMMVVEGVALLALLKTDPEMRGSGRARALVAEVLPNYDGMDVYALLDPDDGQDRVESMSGFAAEFDFQPVNTDSLQTALARHRITVVGTDWAKAVVRRART